MYFVIGEPPSVIGGVQRSSTKFLSQSYASGVPGLPGSSNGFFAVMYVSVASGSETPSSFTADTRNRYFLLAARTRNLYVCPSISPSTSALHRALPESPAYTHVPLTSSSFSMM